MQTTTSKRHIPFDFVNERPHRSRKFLKFLIIVCIIGFSLGITIAFALWNQKTDLVSPVPSTLNYLEVPQVYAAASTSNDVKTPEVQHIEDQVSPKLTYTGHVSYYSHAGCLGCGEKQTMGNGKAFDENAMTLAVPCELIKNKTLKYNTSVVVSNVVSGKSIKAKITDCGGFSKYGRIADLSKGLFEALNAKTDKTLIRIEVL